MSEIMSQKWTAFVFGVKYLHQTFTECVSNQYTHFDTSICQIWLQVMESHLILFLFCVFSCILDEDSCLKFFILTKLSQIVTLINVHILVYQYANCDCRLWKILWFDRVLGIFIYYVLHIWKVITSSKFYSILM